MARSYMCAQSGAVSVAAAPTTKTILGLIAPANQALAIKRWIISCEGVAPTDKPILVEMGKPTAGTQVAATEFQLSGPVPGAIQGAAVTYSAEPTWTSLVYYPHYLHLQSGYEKVLQRAEDEWVFVNSIWALRVTNTSGNSTTNIIVAVEWEE